ncbi:MAG: HEAT repeat domain-containing protein [Bryobacteraceae bacterium]
MTTLTNSKLRAAIALLTAAGAFAATPGERELKDDAGNTILKYVVEAPPGLAAAGTSDPARQVGLVICSQEHDTPTGNDIFPVRQSLLRQGRLDQYVLLAPAPQSRKFGLADHRPIEELIAWALKTYPINPRRVYMYGKGEGSKISMEFAMMHPKLVTAAIGYSWGAWVMPSEVSEPIDFAGSAPEIYLTLGRRDLSYHLTCVRDAHFRLASKGYRMIYREFDDLGDRTYHPPSNDDALEWATRLRNKNIAPSREEAKLLESPKIAGGYYPAIALVGGAPAGAVLRKLFASADEKVRAAAVETCAHGIYDEDATEALAKLLADPSVTVRRAASRAMAMYANWRSKAAQQALIGMATNVAADPLDRLSAADGIAYALRYQVKGARLDPALFATMVALLKDEYEPVRATAIGALMPAYEHTGDGPKRRREPEGGWQAWLDSIQAAEIVPQTGLHFAKTLRAAEGGDPVAQKAVALMYSNGKGVEQNYPEAVKWWTKVALTGDAAAARHAWDLYRTGPGGLARDPEVLAKLAGMVGETVPAPRR